MKLKKLILLSLMFLVFACKKSETPTETQTLYSGPNSFLKSLSGQITALNEKEHFTAAWKNGESILWDSVLAVKTLQNPKLETILLPIRHGLKNTNRYIAFAKDSINAMSMAGEYQSLKAFYSQQKAKTSLSVKTIKYASNKNIPGIAKLHKPEALAINVPNGWCLVTINQMIISYVVQNEIDWNSYWQELALQIQLTLNNGGFEAFAAYNNGRIEVAVAPGGAGIINEYWIAANNIGKNSQWVTVVDIQMPEPETSCGSGGPGGIGGGGDIPAPVTPTPEEEQCMEDKYGTGWIRTVGMYDMPEEVTDLGWDGTGNRRQIKHWKVIMEEKTPGASYRLISYDIAKQKEANGHWTYQEFNHLHVLPEYNNVIGFTLTYTDAFPPETVMNDTDVAVNLVYNLDASFNCGNGPALIRHLLTNEEAQYQYFIR